MRDRERETARLNPGQGSRDGNRVSVFGMKPDLAELLELAALDLARFRAEWEALKPPCPSLAPGSTGQLVPHPYVKLIRDAERAVVALSGGLSASKSRGGRPVGAQSAPDRVSRLKLMSGESSRTGA